MYHAKESGRNNCQFFQESLQPSSRARLALESDLRRAIERDEIQVHYQPRVDMQSGQPTGFEALARWHHPELGMIAPGEFVPLAEESGLIVALGDLVLRRACLQARHWAESGMDNFRVSVNLSPLQFKNQSIFETIRGILEETGLSPGFLELEITESTLMENEQMAAEALHALKGIGITVSLDDFGTGYSSLSYLKRFPVDTVKIDRSFVRDITRDADDAAIVAAIISMAKALDLQIVAEGVETENQRVFLSERGCHEIQGFLVSPAVPANSIEELIGKEDA
jgi:EAL domain-containing protein (putative c-di-GMP-specific phosphodiesterase class I)